jgi:hypothetical protein
VADPICGIISAEHARTPVVKIEVDIFFIIFLLLLFDGNQMSESVRFRPPVLLTKGSLFNFKLILQVRGSLMADFFMIIGLDSFTHPLIVETTMG